MSALGLAMTRTNEVMRPLSTQLVEDRFDAFSEFAYRVLVSLRVWSRIPLIQYSPCRAGPPGLLPWTANMQPLSQTTDTDSTPFPMVLICRKDKADSRPFTPYPQPTAVFCFGAWTVFGKLLSWSRALFHLQLARLNPPDFSKLLLNTAHDVTGMPDATVL